MYIYLFKPPLKKHTDLMDVIIDNNIKYIDDNEIDVEPQSTESNIVEGRTYSH